MIKQAFIFLEFMIFNYYFWSNHVYLY